MKAAVEIKVDVKEIADILSDRAKALCPEEYKPTGVKFDFDIQYIGDQRDGRYAATLLGATIACARVPKDFGPNYPG